MLSVASAIASASCTYVAAPVPRPKSVFDPVAFTLTLPGSSPLGLFDPLGFCAGEATEKQVRLYREVELKHARIAMLATAGFVANELAPSALWMPLLLASVAVGEAATYSTVGVVAKGRFANGEPRVAGDFKFDPLRLRPGKPSDFLDRQANELALGRAAMLGIVGMVAQEFACGQQLFCPPH